MEFKEFGIENEKTLMLLPGTCCNWETNFGTVVDELKSRYHLICVNYDGFDGTDAVFPDMITVTENIEQYIRDNHNGRIDGALGSSLGGSFVGQLIQRRNVHVDHGILGSSDLDQSGKLAARLQTRIMYPIIAGAATGDGRRQKTMRKVMTSFGMDEAMVQKFMDCFARFKPESILNEYYTDLITCLENDIYVPHTRVHIIYALKMGMKYGERYSRYFRDPDIRAFNMQHEEWLFGNKRWEEPVLRAIDEFMSMPV